MTYVKAKVISFDPASRMLVVRDTRGELRRFRVDEEVVQAGDLNADDAVVLTVRADARGTRQRVSGLQRSAGSGSAPAGEAQELTAAMTAVIVSVDTSDGTVLVRDPDGNMRRLDAELGVGLEDLRAGEKVILTLRGTTDLDKTGGKVAAIERTGGPQASVSGERRTPASRSQGRRSANVLARSPIPSPAAKPRATVVLRPSPSPTESPSPSAGAVGVMIEAPVAPARVATVPVVSAPVVSAPVVSAPVVPGPAQVATAVIPAAPVAAAAAPNANLVAVAARDFAAKATELALQADVVDRVWVEYKTMCLRAETRQTTRRTYETAREWLMLWDGGGTPEESPARCDEMYDRVIDAGEPVNREMAAAEEQALKFGVLPGTLREVERLQRLEWSGWGKPKPASRGLAR